MARRSLLLVMVISLCTASRIDAANPPVIGTNQRTLVICVRYSDAATTRMANCSDWVTLLNNEVDTFYNLTTFNQTNFLFETISGAGAPANGWLDLGYASTNYNFFTTGQDAVNLADPFANFANYNRVLVITNWPDFGGQGGGPWGWHVNEGVEWTDMTGGLRAMTFSIVNEWHAHDYGLSVDEAGCVIDHELGHQLGAPTHYGGLNFPPDIGRDTITPWDIMGLSPTRNHFLGFPKTDRGWVPDSAPRVQTVGPPAGSSIDTTILLRPLETATGSTQVIKIPLTAGPNFVGYMVENRKRTNGDQDLPNEGVLVTAVDRSPATIIPAYVVDNPAAPGDLNSAPLSVGQSYSDAGYNLTITNVSASGNDYNVRVQYGLPPSSRPDPMVTPWGAPPYETPDIWIDSSKNGWGTYHYHDGSGNPIGNGDDAWVAHGNRLYVKVHNIGPGVATNVKVQMFVNSPPGMGDAGPNWDYLGTIIFPSIAAGSDSSSFVTWTPTVGAHTCVKAVILDSPDELSTSNNVAQENVTAFDTSSGSPFDPVVLKSVVYNPYDDRELPIHINVRDVPFGWGVVVDKQDFVLPKAGKNEVTVIVYPSGIPDCRNPKRAQPNEKLRPGYIGMPKVEAQMPWGDTWIPIGGIDIWTHLTHKTRLTCRIRGAKERVARIAAPPIFTAMPKPPAMVRGGKIERGKAVKIDPAKIGQWTTMVPKTPAPPSVRAGVIVIEGELDPASAKQPIAVELTHQGKSRLLHTFTDENGHYVARSQVGAGGLWRVQSFFAGDDTLAAADSGFCSFDLIATAVRR